MDEPERRIKVKKVEFLEKLNELKSRLQTTVLIKEVDRCIKDYENTYIARDLNNARFIDLKKQFLVIIEKRENLALAEMPEFQVPQKVFECYENLYSFQKQLEYFYQKHYVDIIEFADNIEDEWIKEMKTKKVEEKSDKQEVELVVEKDYKIITEKPKQAEEFQVTDLQKKYRSTFTLLCANYRIYKDQARFTSDIEEKKLWFNKAQLIVKEIFGLLPDLPRVETHYGSMPLPEAFEKLTGDKLRLANE